MTRWVRALVIVLGAVALGLYSQTGIAAAATIQVNTTADENGTGGNCSIREAVTAANTNAAFGGCPAGSGADTITFSVNGTFLLTLGELLVTDSLTISGNGQSDTILDGNNASRVLHIAETASFEIQDLTIQHGRATTGGGLLVEARGAFGRTGAITGVTVRNNRATGGNGGGASLGDLASPPPDPFGRPCAHVSVSDSLFEENAATAVGGGLHYFTVDVNTIMCSLSGNLGLDPVLITESTIRANTASEGGGIGFTFEGLRQQELTPLFVAILDRTVVTGNTASNRGGGIAGGFDSAGNNNLFVLPRRATVSGNVAGTDGGGIFASALAGINSTISGNTAGSRGGGVALRDIITNAVTIAGNSANSGGGIYLRPTPPPDSRTTSVRSTIIGQNGGGDCGGESFTSRGFNIASDTTCNASLTQGTDQKNINPLLAPLDDYGGPTETHALRTGSPALDNHTCVPGEGTSDTEDQRGISRPQNGLCDVGAFEGRVSDITGGDTLARPAAVPGADSTGQKSNDDEDDKPKETEEQRQQRERTNRSNRSDYATEGNVTAVEPASDGKHLLVTIALTRNETLIVQVACPVGKCPDIRAGDYLEADGYQNGVGDPNSYFVADDVTVRRGGKRVN